MMAYEKQVEIDRCSLSSPEYISSITSKCGHLHRHLGLQQYPLEDLNELCVVITCLCTNIFAVLINILYH